jgi:hypothetical protein
MKLLATISMDLGVVDHTFNSSDPEEEKGIQWESTSPVYAVQKSL